MDGQIASISPPHDLYARLGTAGAPLVLDVRRAAAFDQAKRLITWPSTKTRWHKVTELSAGENTKASTPKHGVSWGEAFRVWLRIAALRFGEPAGQTAVMDLHNLAIRATILAGALVFCMMEASIAMADQASFADDTVGASPKGWTATMTGKGNPKWTVEEDPTARSKARVVKQSGTATYPLLLKDGTNLKNGFVEIWFRAISGSEDRAAGIVWRARDASNYYVVRANALENNVVAYKTVNGTRSALDIVGRRGGYGVKVPVPSGQWHALRVEFAGRHFKVIFNGKPAFEVEDGTFSEAGQIGLWTKADSVTAFDDVSYGAAR